MLAGLTERKNLLVAIERGDTASALSLRNLPNVHLLWVDQLNTYDVLCADDIVFTAAALRSFVGADEPVAKATSPARSATKKAAATSTDDAAEESAPAEEEAK